MPRSFPNEARERVAKSKRRVVHFFADCDGLRRDSPRGEGTFEPRDWEPRRRSKLGTDG